MAEEAYTIAVGGLSLYAYGLMLAVGCLSGCVFLLLRSRRTEREKNAAALTCLLSPFLGLAFSRLVYVLGEISFAPFLNLVNAVNLRLGGLSMYGALIGAVLGAIAAARLAGVRASLWLDRLAPSLLLMIVFARLGEHFTSLGISRPLVTGVLDSTFLAMHTEYDAYLRTYLLESLGAMVLLAAVLRYQRNQTKPGQVFLFAALQFGVWQTLFESLRFDSHLRFSFIGLQQLLSAALMGGVLITLAVRLLKSGRRKKLAVLSLCALLPVIGAIIALEFLIDRSQINKWISYAVYVAVLLIPCVLGSLMLREERV